MHLPDLNRDGHSEERKKERIRPWLYIYYVPYKKFVFCLSYLIPEYQKLALNFFGASPRGLNDDLSEFPPGLSACPDKVYHG